MSKSKIDGSMITIYVVFGVLFALTIDFGIGDWKQREASEQFYTELQSSGLTVLEGIIESPSLILVADNPQKFIEIVTEQNQDTVYDYQEYEYPRRRSFYAFNDAMTIAWKYTPEWGK